MLYTIPKDKHKARPIRWGLRMSDKFSWKVEFTDSCVYYLPTDQLDINKLCGIRYLFGDNSARFGWRYNPAKPDGIEIMAYVHDRGKVTKGYDEILIKHVPLNQEVTLKLIVNPTNYYFFVDSASVRVPKSHDYYLSFKQNIYFGGNLPAPQDIIIHLECVQK